MARFNYYKDELVKVWQRLSFSVEASSKEEADKEAKRFVDSYPDFDECNVLYDTQEILSPFENEGNATQEIFDEDGTLLTDNHCLTLEKAYVIKKLNYSNIKIYNKKSGDSSSYHKLLFKQEQLDSSDNIVYRFESLDGDLLLNEQQLQRLCTNGTFENTDLFINVDKWGDQCKLPKPMYVTCRYNNERIAVKCFTENEITDVSYELYSRAGVQYLNKNYSGVLKKNVCVHSLKQYLKNEL